MEIIEVNTSKQLKAFIKFPFELYKGNPYYVPPIINFEWNTLEKNKNPAFEHCQAKYWLAYDKNKIVGRVAAIKNYQEFQEKKSIRFGWIDFVDEYEVVKILLDKLMDWAKKENAKVIHGPLGFTDLDFEGCLIDGFDQIATQATIYNYAYYPKHYETYGLKKAVDWVEIRGEIPDEIPEKINRSASIVANRFNFTIKKFRKAKDILFYAKKIFDVINESYSELYGYYPLSEKQINYYIKQYFGFIRKEYVCVVTDKEDNIIGIALSIPSLSKAFQKAKGKFFPFGFFHILKAFKSNEHLDLFLIGIKPSHQNMGVTTMIFSHLLKTYIKNHVKFISTGPILENNHKMLNVWNDYFKKRINIRRRCYIKKIK